MTLAFTFPYTKVSVIIKNIKAVICVSVSLLNVISCSYRVFFACIELPLERT